MLRNGDLSQVSWPNKTWTALQRQKVEACIKFIRSCPDFNLFDPACTDLNVQQLYDLSYYGEEAPHVLCTVSALQEEVRKNLPGEVFLLSAEEVKLFTFVTLHSGKATVPDLWVLPTALSLVKRLWATVNLKGNTFDVSISPDITLEVLLQCSLPNQDKVKEAICCVCNEVDLMLQMDGMLEAEPIILQLQEVLHKVIPDRKQSRNLILRLLKSGYDYIYDDAGNMMLIHDGLAEPERLLQEGNFWADDRLAGDEAAEEMTNYEIEQEDTEMEALSHLIEKQLRPETHSEEVARDILLMVLQAAPLEALEKVLASHLICKPTREMQAQLMQMQQRLCGWYPKQDSEVQ